MTAGRQAAQEGRQRTPRRQRAGEQRGSRTWAHGAVAGCAQRRAWEERHAETCMDAAPPLNGLFFPGSVGLTQGQ
jgi:hypothetical protein